MQVQANRERRRKRAWAELAAGLRVTFTIQPVPSASSRTAELNPGVVMEYNQQMRIGEVLSQGRGKTPQAALVHSSAMLHTQ